MTLSALLTPIVVPPVNLAALALLAALRRWHVLTMASLAGLLVLGMPVTASLLFGSLLSPSRPLDRTGVQAILVLGGDIDRDTGGAIPGPLSLERLRDAARLARKTNLPVAITGGPLWADGPPISIVMAASLAHDFSVTARWTETQSADTWHNASDSAAILLPLGIHRVFLVTQAWHMPRALIAFRRTGLAGTPAPVQRFGYPSTGLGPTSFIPTARSWRDSSFALHEWIGILDYRIRGLVS